MDIDEIVIELGEVAEETKGDPGLAGEGCPVIPRQ